MTVVMMSSYYGNSICNTSSNSNISDISEILERIIVPSSKNNYLQEESKQQLDDHYVDRLHNSYNSSHRQFRISFSTDNKISLCNDKKLEKKYEEEEKSNNDNDISYSSSFVYDELKYEICSLKEKVLLLEHQLKSSNEQCQIQISQYEERIAIQDERIKNQQQQLSLINKTQPAFISSSSSSLSPHDEKTNNEKQKEEEPSMMRMISNNMMSDWQDTTSTNRGGISYNTTSNNDFIIPNTTSKKRNRY